MSVTNGYPTSPLSTAVPVKANTTQALEVAGFAQYDNSEYEVINIGRKYHPLMYTLTAMGRYLRGDMKNLGVNEGSSTNFPEYKWDERDEYNDLFTVNNSGGYNSSATTIVLDSTAGLYANLILRNTTTNERIRITSVDSATQLTVQRGVGETAAASIADDAELLVVANASEDGKASESSFFVANQHKSNYFQKIVTTVSQSDFQRLGYKVGNYAETIMAEKLGQHAEEKERVALFGEKKSSTNPSTGKAFYTAGGVIDHCLDGYTDDISSALTIDTFEEAMENPLRYGSKTKILLGSYKTIRAIRALYMDYLTINDSLKDIDLKFETITINSGEFQLLSHPFLDSNSGYEDYIFVVDPQFIKFIYPAASNEGGVMFGIDGKTKFLVNNAATTPTYSEGSYYTYFTLMRSNANAFGAFKIL